MARGSRILLLAGGLLAAALLDGCSGSIPRFTSGGMGEEALLLEGEASYYGDEFAGRATSSGEVYSPEGLTAAHRSLPFGTRVRVTNLANGVSVVVRVNDRGPWKKERIVDLSKEAARRLKMIEQGTAQVRLEILR
jgi:rare lipoprotein A